MTITPIVPAPTQLAGDLARAQEVLAGVTAAIEVAGPGAAAFTRCAVQVKSAEAVDALGKAWGVVPQWSAGHTLYVARWTLGGREAEAEAVFYAPASQAAGSGAGA